MSLKDLENKLLQDAEVKMGYDRPDAALKMGKLLRELRNSQKVTQRELEKKSGILQSEISRYEAGNGARGITITQLERIAHAQGVDVVIGFTETSTSGATQAGDIVIDGHKLLMHTII